MSQIRCKCGADLDESEVIEEHIGTDGTHYRRYQCACAPVGVSSMSRKGRIYVKTIQAKPISYGAKRDKKNVKFIVIHYTGVKGDTAVGEASYFAHGNTRTAGAHFFVDRQGNVVKSIPMNLTAWSVGGKKYSNTKGGTFYELCKNANSVSIELCDIVDKKPSEKQIKATRKLVAFIKKKCPNAKYIIRHYDVTGKLCPASMISPTVWTKFKDNIR